MARRKPTSEGPGQDSFLDIVANLVGILIILVMVVGLRAKDAIVREVTQAEDPTPEIDVAGAAQTVANIERDINTDLERELRDQQRAVAAATIVRNRLDVMVAATERELAQRRESLDASGQATFDVNRELDAAATELRTIEQTRRVVENATAPPAVLEHIPTPLAKTVYSKEAHFRLLDGRLVHIAVEQLEKAMMADVQRRIAEASRADGAFVSTVGPIGGFRLRYTLKKAAFVRDTGLGSTRHSRVELDHYVLVPVTDAMGEPFENAMESSSQFNAILSRLDARNTTITVWVYPTDFANFRRLKSELFRRGHIAASRPLPTGAPIGGSPTGSRTVVQ